MKIQFIIAQKLDSVKSFPLDFHLYYIVYQKKTPGGSLYKKAISLFLLVLLVFGLCSCGKKDAGKAEPSVFSVGYGRASIHPTSSIQLAGK